MVTAKNLRAGLLAIVFAATLVACDSGNEDSTEQEMSSDQVTSENHSHANQDQDDDDFGSFGQYSRHGGGVGQGTDLGGGMYIDSESGDIAFGTDLGF